jgi:hypothetical protein
MCVLYGYAEVWMRDMYGCIFGLYIHMYVCMYGCTVQSYEAVKYVFLHVFMSVFIHACTLYLWL